MARKVTRTRNYRRGYACEKRVRRLWERNGWYVMESRGSHGPADLACFHPELDPVLVQVKFSSKGQAKISPDEEAAFVAHCSKYCVRGVIALQGGRSPIRLRWVAGYKHAEVS